MTTDQSTEMTAEKLRGLLTRMGVEAEVVERDEADRIVLEIQGAEAGLVIGKHGATLDALQYLLNRMVLRGGPAGAGGQLKRTVVVDAEGYRDRRNEALVELAQRLAAKARKTKRPVAASPMSPADRRVMHLALADMPGMKTQSEGEGAARHLVIVPEPGFDFGEDAGSGEEA